jgi:hypothetical protein
VHVRIGKAQSQSGGNSDQPPHAALCANRTPRCTDITDQERARAFPHPGDTTSNDPVEVSCDGDGRYSEGHRVCSEEVQLPTWGI